MSWTPAGDGGSPLTGYLIAAQPSDLGLTVDDGTQTSATISGLPDGTYTFTVRAKNADGRSLPSQKSPAVTITGGDTVTVPDPPVNVSATPGDQSATVSWTPPANTGGWPITDYKVNVNPGKGVSMLAAADATSLLFTGLTNGVEYSFTVQAGNDLGRSAHSEASNSVVPGNGAVATAPAAPTNVRATASGNTATITWTAPADNGGAQVRQYRVSAQPGGAFALVDAPTTTASMDLPNGTYTFVVRASNDAGQSPASAPSNSVTTPASAATAQGRGQLFGITSDGTLYRYLTTGTGDLAYPPARIGGGWKGYTLVSGGDFTADGRSDLLARTPAGDLMLYKGNGTGGLVYPPTRIGGGWNGMTRMVSPGDLTGDGKADLLARKTTGDLMLYKGNGTGGLVYPPTRIGGGWNVMDRLLSPGDFTGDGKADLLARKTTGDLMLYKGNGSGNFVYPPVRLGGGWGIYDRLTSTGDFNGDGRGDIIGRKTSGELVYYRGTGTGNLHYPPLRIGGGWTVYGPVMGIR